MRKPKPIRHVTDPKLSVDRAPPVMPEPPEVPGPPGPLDAQEWTAWRKYEADIAEYRASLFSVEELRGIVAGVGAPPLMDTPTARAIALLVSTEKSDLLSPSSREASLHDPVAWQAWEVIRQLLNNRLTHEQEHAELMRGLSLMRGADPTRTGPAKRLASDNIQRLQAFLLAMDDIKPLLSLHKPNAPRKRRGALVRRPKLAAKLFDWLRQAWIEAGEKLASKEKTYKIVRELLVCAGDPPADVSAVKSAIIRQRR